MTIVHQGTYALVSETYDLQIDYHYYYCSGDYEHPPEEDLEIKAVTLNDEDITDFFWDLVEDQVYEQVMQHARDNLNK